MIPQETDPDLPVSVKETLAEAWVAGGLMQGWGTECSSTCIGSFEGGLSLLPPLSTISTYHYLHYLHHSLAPGE